MSASVGCENEIARHDHPNGKARPDREGPLDVKLPLDDLLTGLADAVGGAAPDRLDQVVLILAGAGFGTDTEQRREHGRLEQHAPMIVDLVLESGIT